MFKNGEIINGKYEILSLIGKGGMSYVYLALDRRSGKRWAIKEVRRDGTGDYALVRQTLVAESGMLKKLSHPNLPDIVDIIENDNSFLIVMDYVDGKNLGEILEIGGAQKEKFVIEWSEQICDVLSYLHSRKPPIIYRDLKPSNIMLKSDGTISIIDFGTAREYKQQKLSDTICLGTHGYAAPEQYDINRQTDQRTDVYCLGATMYQLLTNQIPYELLPVRQIEPSVSAGLEAIILKCMQSNPDDRFQSCDEVRYALEHIEEGMFDYWLSQKKKINVFLISIIATLLCFLLGVFGLVLKTFSQSNMFDVLSKIGIFLGVGLCMVTVILAFTLNIKSAFLYLTEEKQKSSQAKTDELSDGLEEKGISEIQQLYEQLELKKSIADTDSAGEDLHGQTGIVGKQDIDPSFYSMNMTTPLSEEMISGGKFEIKKEVMLIHSDVNIYSE